MTYLFLSCWNFTFLHFKMFYPKRHWNNIFVIVYYILRIISIWIWRVRGYVAEAVTALGIPFTVKSVLPPAADNSHLEQLELPPHTPENYTPPQCTASDWLVWGYKSTHLLASMQDKLYSAAYMPDLLKGPGGGHISPEATFLLSFFPFAIMFPSLPFRILLEHSPKSHPHINPHIRLCL